MDHAGLRPVRLRINADDFGRSSRVNQAVVQAHREGVLSSTSLMVTEAAADEAVDLARAHPGLAVGLHLCLTDAPPALDHGGALGPLDADGRLATSPVAQGFRLALLGRARRAAAAEVEAQLDRFVATALPLRHVDGHINLHLVPAVVEALCRLLPRYGSPEVRVPREALGPALALRARPLLYKLSHAPVFAALGAWARRRLARAGIPVADRVLGLLSTFDPPDARVLAGLVAQARGTTEVYLHPGAVPPEVDSELKALLSPEVARAVARVAGAPRP